MHFFKCENWDTNYRHIINNDIQCPDGAYLQKLSLDFISNTYCLPIYFNIFNTIGNIYIGVDLNKYSFVLYAPNIRVPNDYESILIQNKYYYNLNYFKNQLDPDYNTKYNCYYNKEFGILKIETEDGNLELLKLKN